MKQRSENKREAILKAAFEVISRRGYYEAKVDDIARVAGVAKGTIYLYFRDKPDIYAGLLGWLMEQAAAIVRDVTGQPLSAAQRLRLVFEAWADGVLAQPGVLALISIENLRLAGPALHRLHSAVLPRMQQLILDIAALIESGIKSGEFRPTNTRLAALLYLQAFRSTILATRRRSQARAAADAALDIIFSGLLQPASRPAARTRRSH